MVESPALLLITRNLPPLRGGMERLNAHMVQALAANHRVTVVAPKGSRIESAGSLRVHSCPLPGTAIFLIWATFASIAVAITQRPRWIVGGSGLVAPVVLLAGIFCTARRGIYLHGLDIVVRSRIYQSFWLPAIRRVHLCIVNSRNTRKLAIAKGIEASTIHIVMPGVALPEKDDEESRRLDGDRFRADRELGTGPIILSVGRLTRRKGLLEFIEKALKPILDARPDARLVIAGDDAPDALNQSGGSQRVRIEEVVRRMGCADSVRLLGPVTESELRAAFAAAHVHVFPGIDVPGDVEGFGMVAIEAAAYGVPTVAFDVGGVSDAIDDSRSGDLVTAGDYTLLSQRLLERMDSLDSDVRSSCRAFASGFAWPIFDETLRATLASGDAS